MPALTNPARLGAVAWTLTILYFPIQLVVALAWPEPYSLTANTISDLGVTSCGQSNPFPGREIFVCSPLHPLMNIGFVFVGVTTAVGAILTRRAWPRSRLTTAALIGVNLAGAGGVLVGLAPSDTALHLHSLGALLQLPAVMAPIFLGLALRHERRRLAAFSLVVGAVGAVGTVLFVLRLPALWFGILERLALEPFTLWTFALGVTLLRPPAATRVRSIEDTGGELRPLA
ncbi:DUF998 domain-containing protein [Streptosporangium sp. NPDC005286]|uniref:DUF998 domain-containing protein n=1 Tax=Streptosporangium sp. NPDC005286 TaxID=3154463 RepID=UPI0033AE2ED7